MKPFSWVACGALLAGLSVAAGAFGAHGLKGKLAADTSLSAETAAHRLQIFDIAARYHMYHGLAIVLTGLLVAKHPSSWFSAGGWSFVGGIVVFCGCLYALALGGPPMLGAVVPIGGVGFLAGWSCMAIGALRSGQGPTLQESPRSR